MVSPKAILPPIETTVEFQRGKSLALVNKDQMIEASAWMAMLMEVSRLKVVLVVAALTVGVVALMMGVFLI
jgi:hypothetical protein